MVIRVLLADDNALFRDGMAQLLRRFPDVDVAGLARNASEAVHKAGVVRPDVVLMDISMPHGGGIAATRHVLAERPGQAICMLTESEQESDLFAAVIAGARGYLVKTVVLEDLHYALQVLAEGGSIISPHLAVRLLEQFARMLNHAGDAPGSLDRLSARERSVLELVATGASNRDIAARLSITENTVKVHLRNVLDKLYLRNRHHAAAFAVQSGLVSPSSLK